MRLQQDSNFTTLSWVKPELDETLRLARQALETYVESGAERGQMQVCVAQLHQVQGTLRMVELYGAAMVAEEMEQLATALLGTSVANREEAYGALMRSIMQLPDYLERLQSGHKDIPMVLLPLLNDLRGARGEKVVPESVLFSVDLGRPLPASVGPVPAAMDLELLRANITPLHAKFQNALLPWLRDEERPDNIAALRDACATMVGLINGDAARKLFWIAAGIFDALYSGAFVASKPLKQALAKLEREIKRLGDEGESAFAAAPPTELTRQLLYYVATAPTDDARFVAIRDAFGLDREQLNEAELAHARGSLTGHNRELLDTVSAGIKEDLLRVKEALDMHMRTSGAPVAELAPQAEALGAIADTLGMLGLGVPRKVVQDQRAAIQALSSGQRAADESALMDIAGSLLYVEASLDDQVARLGQPSEGQQAQETGAMPLRESQQALEALITESVANFVQARQCFVAFIEAGWDHAQLHDVPRLLDEVSGAMHLLEQTRAARQLHALSVFTRIELVQLQRVPDAAQMDRLADALASLEYYLEALRDHRPQRDRILELAEHGLVALGYWPVPAAAEQAIADAARRKEVPAATVVEPAEAMLDVPEEVAATEVAESAAAEPLAAASEPAAPVSVAASKTNYGFADSTEIDDDIREVFIEELDEEVNNLNELYATWSAAPNNTEVLRPLRRVFHTLKGSGRLVGALELGEFSWHIESMLNRVLDGSRPASPAVVSIVGHAAASLPQFRAALMGTGHVTADIEGLKAYADRVAAGEEAFYAPAPAVLEPAAATEHVEAAPVEAAQVETTAAAEAVAEPEVETAISGSEYAIVDPVLLEILRAEVGAHLQTIQQWSAANAASPQPATDTLLRAVHTISGAFAMTEVPLITDVLSPTEGYIRRLLAHHELPSADGVALVRDVAQAIDGVLDALQQPRPLIAPQVALAERAVALRDQMPEPTTPTMPVHLEEYEEELLAQHSEPVPASELVDILNEIPGEAEAAQQAERIAAEQAEAERIAAEHAEAERAAAAQAEAERVAAEHAETERMAAAAHAEAERVAAERAEAERIAAEHAEAERVAAEHAEAERIAAEHAEAERIAAEHAEAERIAAEHAEAERIAAEHAETERVATERAEAEQRAAAEQAEAERLEYEKLEAEYAEADRLAAEQRAAAGHAGAEHAAPEPATTELESERIAAEQAEAERIAAEHAEAAHIAAEQEAERVAAEQAEAERIAAEHAEADRIAAEQAEAERVATEHAEAERIAAEQAEAERVAAEQAEAERIAAEHAEAERVAAEQAEAERVAAERAEAQRIAAEQAEAARVAAEQAEAERVAAQNAEAAQAAAEKPLTGKAAKKAAAAQKAAAEKEAAERAATEALGAEVAHAAQEAIVAPSAAEEAASEGLAAAEATKRGGAYVPSEIEADPDEPLDLSDIDPELLDIFIEETTDILDHCDGLLTRLRAAPSEREPVVGLQRDLHTLKGGARMSGMMSMGELAHAMEFLLEAAAEQRMELGARGLGMLEHGFDRLHGMLSRTIQRQAVALPEQLIAEFTALAKGEAVKTRAPAAAPAPTETPAPAEAAQPAETTEATATGEAAETTSEAAESTEPAAAHPARAKPSMKPLSAPVEAGFDEEDDIGVRAPQEQVRIRADLLDRLVNYAGEVAIYRARLEQQLGTFRTHLDELEQTTTRLRTQLRKLEIETEAQISARYQRAGDGEEAFDPLELDRFSTQQQLTRALAESAADMTSLHVSLDDVTRQYETLLLQQSRVSSELQDGLMRTRMVPFDALVPRLRRVVRQTGTEVGKQVQLKVEGAQGEMDRNVLDRMTAPLEHMLRNAVVHGLESPQARRDAGKPEEGTVTVSMHREGSEVVMLVTDDGRGLDRDAIRRKAIDRGLLKPDAEVSDSALYAFILESGFSTAENVSRLAGRGVGMDVVHNEIRQLGGSLQLDSTAGKGSQFTIRLPFTLAVTQAAMVKIGETSFAVPISSVQGVGRIARAELEKQLASGSPVYVYAGEDYAIHDLGRLLGGAPAKAQGSLQMPLLLSRSGDIRAAICVDEVLGSREIVVKPVGPQVSSIPGIFGATIMGDGGVMVILDVVPLVRRALAHVEPEEVVVEVPQEVRRVPLVMVVDDSITMRKVTGRVLERNNMEVMAAKDGIDAIEKMVDRVPDLMLLDIEMPRMDGYELATHMRNDPRLRDVAIIMITSRTGEKHRQRAFEIGVNRYLGKPYQEVELMRNVFELLAPVHNDG